MSIVNIVFHLRFAYQIAICLLSVCLFVCADHVGVIEGGRPTRTNDFVNNIEFYDAMIYTYVYLALLDIAKVNLL